MISILSSCAILKHGEIEYIKAMTDLNSDVVLYIPVEDVKVNTDDVFYQKLYYKYGTEWHYGKTWFNSVEYPYRGKKEQERFVKRYYKSHKKH